MVADVASVTFLRIELPVIKVGFSVGVSLGGENLLETLVGVYSIMGFGLGGILLLDRHPAFLQRDSKEELR